MKDTAFDLLAVLERRMRELIACLESRDTSPEAIARAWAACEYAGTDLGDPRELLESTSPAQRPGVIKRMSVIVELNRLARDLADQARTETSEALDKTRRASSTLQNLDRPDDGGRRFDRSG